jgi:hypothetical protein
MNIQHQAIENSLLQLIKGLEKYFSPSEITEVFEFIEPSEYGLALDTVIDIIIEENKFISNDILKLITELSDLMELDSKIIVDKLSAHML